MIESDHAAARDFAARIEAAAGDGLEGHFGVAPLLGARPGEVTTVAVWTPQARGEVALEVLRPPEGLDLTAARQEATFERATVPMVRAGEYSVAAVRGMRAGTRERIGDFYALVVDGERAFDPLAASVPYGAFAPAELYDLAAMHEGRTDADWFAAYGGGRAAPPTAILQVHVPSATREGTLAALTRRYRTLTDKIAAGGEPDLEERLFLGYDAIQLLPVEPTTVYEAGPSFWDGDAPRGEGGVTVTLRRPDTTNWGYDVVISGMGAVNPVLLETGRPDELVDLAEALHAFPNGGKKLIFDVVFGHSDNQGLGALPPHWFAGANMYGQNLDYRRSAVRAQLLEMQRRKVDFGADGVRVDGAQDFKWWTGEALVHDDAYLLSMRDVPQEVAGHPYRPWFVFEDGRPWPEPDWELASDYRALTKLTGDRDVFQWGPLTFAHNTPFLYTFWLSKLWRIREICEVGDSWISGCSNHDTLRRGTQVDVKLNVNNRLGETRMEILDKAYDNPVVAALTYAVLPGVPMDFLNAAARASWGFIRNQDDLYGVKVVAEEAISLKWQVDEAAYDSPENFRRLKALGYETREDLARYFEFLPALVEVTEYDLGQISHLLNVVQPPLPGKPYDPAALKETARAWMDDMHAYCNVAHAAPLLEDAQTGFMLDLRRFRRERPWLRGAFGEGDALDVMRPIDGRTVFVGQRRGAGEGSVPRKEVRAVLHMEGSPVTLDPLEGAGDGWRLALATPAVPEGYADGPLEMRDSMGLVFVRGR